MVFNATFNSISVILWWSVFLVEETGLPRENHWTVASHWQTLSLYHIMLYQVHLAWTGFKLTMLVVIGTDCIGNCKSNCHTIITMMAPIYIQKTSSINTLAEKVLLVWLEKFHCIMHKKNIKDLSSNTILFF